MSKQTFQGWCTPVDISSTTEKYADHTFVYCPTNNKDFKCWGTADRDNKDAAQLCEGHGDQAYCKANDYRCSIGSFKDTAGVGIYAVNGVCHQSANLFLFAVDNTCLPLNKSRPKGIVGSVGLYGMYGTNFGAWLTTIYAKAKFHCWHPHFPHILGTSRDAQRSLTEKIMNIHSGLHTPVDYTRSTERDRHVIDEMSTILSHYIPEVSTNIIEDSHREIVKNKNILLDDLLSRSTPPTDNDTVEFVNKMNKLSIEFQSDLASKLGDENFKQLNGDSNYYNPINPEIAKASFGSIGKSC